MEAGESLGLQHREEIMLSKPEEDEVPTENCTSLADKIFCIQVSLATRLVVSPATPEDWTVLRLNRRQVEREVLDQVDSLYHPISLERGQTHELKCASIHPSISPIKTISSFEGASCH